MIDQHKAIDIAQQRAIKNGWAFIEPVVVNIRKTWGGKITKYEIESNAEVLGSKARFIIDAATGEIISEGYISR